MIKLIYQFKYRGKAMFYPLFFEPIYKQIIWGGKTLAKVFSRELPYDNTAESWEISCHKNGTSVVSNGRLRGKSLSELIKDFGDKLLGSRTNIRDTFPLLIKLIDANDSLSVQVHPDDIYARDIENEYGKTEMWYIVDAKENAQIIYGTKSGVTKEEFKKSIEDGNLEKHLNYMNVKKGDAVFIPSGTVHAILDGILIAEIQQNSDTTYRVYDWNRVDLNGKSRELHIDKALDVINFNFSGSASCRKCYENENYMLKTLIRCQYFNVDSISVKYMYEDKADGSTFIAFTVIEGNGKILHNGIEYKLVPGSSFLIPAAAGEFSIFGQITLLKSYI